MVVPWGLGRGGGGGQRQLQGLSTSLCPWLSAPRPVRPAPPSFYRDVRALGITLMGHQKKILGSIQTMRAQLTITQGPHRHL